MRIRTDKGRFTEKEADILKYCLESENGIAAVKVYERTGDAAISYTCESTVVIAILQRFNFDRAEVPASVWQDSGRQINNEYRDRLVCKIVLRIGKKLFLPYPVRAAIVTIKSVKYILKGMEALAHGRIEVSVLDAAAVATSVIRGDYKTAGSVMFLLGIGELLEEWTHKKSVGDLARSMSLKVNKVWTIVDGKEVLLDTGRIKAGDNIVVHMGNVIPFDGVVISGEGAVNQSSLTGEALPVQKNGGGYVYAGTVLEEGELVIEVRETAGSTRYEKIVTMIEESEKLKSSMEGQAEHLADRLVPYTLLGAGAVYLFTRNVTKALSVLMVDFSCALKLAMPIAVLSAIREAGEWSVTVKGGKFLERIAWADTIVFDKTGTLTKAAPTVAEVVSFNGDEPDELLRIAACMEEHFPHSMAKAVVNAAMEKGLTHEEKHSKVEYIVAHGISSKIDGKKVVIGNHHFVFEDEACVIPEEKKALYDSLPRECSHLYLAIEGVLAAVICIEDPIREEAASVISQLKQLGVSKIVMMTGDSDRTAAAVAGLVGVDEYYSEVLPEEKAGFVEKEKKAGRKVIMIGDGVNDSPALSAADAGIAISDGAEMAREIADVIIEAEDLWAIVKLRRLSESLVKRINKNYVRIVGINSVLILLGVAGFISPATSALLHNTSTLLISLESMTELI